MKKTIYTKIIAISIGLCILPLISNANDIRGSIITKDNKIVAQSINEKIRDYPFKTMFEPILGYLYNDMSGAMGLEKYSEDILKKGFNLHLNIPYRVQRKVELMLDYKITQLDADEIIVGVMESDTGKVLSLASTKRYDPSHVTQEDIPALNPKIAQYPYEAGSVIGPLAISIALDKGLVTPEQSFDTFGGKLPVGEKQWITDDEKFDSLTVTDIIVHSSNVGASQISWSLTGKEFRDGLLKFGLAQPSGIDLSRDLPGYLKDIETLNNKMHRANTSYGYGMLVTPVQLLKAYSAFNNDGVAVTPRLVNYLEDEKGRHYIPEPKINDAQVISKKTANQMQNILLEVVKRGRGVKAQHPGLEIGGKTGTAHIAKNGRYVREYHSSFYGFANDEFGHKYTIGVLVIRAKKKYKYFASQSAAPTFKNLVKILVEEGKLIPNAEAIKKIQEEEMQDSVMDENKTI
jgi:cell division protein FtsI (penicillin-binding protein 3)